MTKILPKILDRRVAAKGNIFTIEQADLEFSNGAKRTHEFVRTRGDAAVLAVPVLNQETILLIREYSLGVERYELGFPKGIMEPGEDPCEAANREMMEEVGFGARKLTYMKLMTAIPGYMKSRMHCVLAQDLYPEKREGDEPEPLEVIEWPIAKINTLLEREDFTEGRCIAALFLALELLKNHG
jgi:ADP-ribose diphosphatase